jgi:PAS domain S-box-containing protein
MAASEATRPLLSSAFDFNPLLLSVADLATDRYLEVNETFCAALGRRREELLGRSAVELGMVTHEERDRLARELMAMLAAPRRYPIEFDIRRADGTALPLRYWAQVVPGPDGVRIFAAAEDLSAARAQPQDSDRARAAEALRRSDERFALAMDAFSDGLWDWDAAARVGYFSPGCYRMLGYPIGGLDPASLDWLAVVHPAERAGFEQAVRETCAGQRASFQGEYRMQTQGGEWLWVLARGRRVSGEGARLLVTLVDITERKQLQLVLAQNDRLASLGLLSAGVAHEINNPLAYVTVNLELLLHQLPRVANAPAPELADLVGLVTAALEGSERVGRIARSLGAFSRVESAEPGPVSVNRALEEAARIASAEVRYRGTVVQELGDVPPARGTEGKLAQVFLNLIVNAAHALEPARQATNVVRLRTWAGDDRVFAEVSDTGVGIPPEHLERVFEPFFTTKPPGVGSGLGLAITRRLVDELEGQLTMESTVGQGTRVVVSLPAFTAAPAPEAPPAAPGPPAARRRARVLLIDDEPQLRQSLERHLSREHDVRSLASALEAQALLAGDRAFDAIVCDLMMPGMSGMEFHAWLTGAVPELAGRVVFISGGAFAPNAAEYLARVPNPRLDKPFELARLLALIDALPPRA